MIKSLKMSSRALLFSSEIVRKFVRRYITNFLRRESERERVVDDDSLQENKRPTLCTDGYNETVVVVGCIYAPGQKEC